MSFRGATPSLLHLRSHLLAGCDRPFLSTLSFLVCSLLIVTADAWLPPGANITALLLLPLLGAAVCCGPKVGIAGAWGVAAVQQGADHLRWGINLPWGMTLLNILIWGAVGTILVLVVVAAMQAQRLREAEVQLRTVQQTMVTVQDIVRNRLQLVTVISDLLEAGVMPQSRHVRLMRSAAVEMLALLDRLSKIEKVVVDEVATGVQAVRITPSDATDQREADQDGEPENAGS